MSLIQTYWYTSIMLLCSFSLSAQIQSQNKLPLPPELFRAAESKPAERQKLKQEIGDFGLLELDEESYAQLLAAAPADWTLTLPVTAANARELTLHLRSRPKWHAFSKLNLEKFLLTRFGIDRLPKVHIVDRYLAAAAPLGVRNDGNGLDYFISPEETVNLQKEKIPANYVAFVIGAAHATKRLTEPQMIDFCAALPHPIVLLGGPAEKEVGARIAHQHEHVINACGNFSLGGSADLVRQAAIVVTHDTGLMHVAAAFHKPIVSIWGNTVPAFGMYPYLPGSEVEEKQRRQEIHGLSCRPCSKIGFDQCPKGHFSCIKAQDPATLAKVAAGLLNEIR